MDEFADDNKQQTRVAAEPLNEVAESSDLPVRERGASHSAGAVGALLALAVPTFGQLVAEPAFVLIDTAIVGHLGQSALAGLALGSTVILTAVGLCIFLAYATTSQVARCFGAGRVRDGLQAGIDGLWLALAIGAVLAAGLFALAEPLCWLLGGRGEDLAQAVAYTRPVVLGAPGMLLVYAANGLYRGLQKVTVTLVVAVAGALLNTVLDVLFVIVLGWGVAGSGAGTFAAQWFMGLVLAAGALRAARKEGVAWRPRLGGVVAAGRDGLPLFVRTLALRAGLVGTVMAAAALGTSVLAGYQVVNASWNFMVNVLDSVAIAGQTLVGAELGAARWDGARRLTRVTLRTGALVGVLAGVVFAALCLVAPSLFSPDAAVQQMAAIGMVITGVALPLQSWMWAADGILIGAGDFRYLARACTAVSAVYLALLAVLVFALSPHLPDAAIRCAALWLTFNIVLMGGRALTNGLRIRTDAWMRG